MDKKCYQILGNSNNKFSIFDFFSQISAHFAHLRGPKSHWGGIMVPHPSRGCGWHHSPNDGSSNGQGGCLRPWCFVMLAQPPSLFWSLIRLLYTPQLQQMALGNKNRLKSPIKKKFDVGHKWAKQACGHLLLDHLGGLTHLQHDLDCNGGSHTTSFAWSYM